MDRWPSPNPALTLPARDQQIAAGLAQHPPLVDEIELTDGRVLLAAILLETEGSIRAWVAGEGQPRLADFPRGEVAGVRRSVPAVALERRLARLVRIEDDVDAGRPLTSASDPAFVLSPAQSALPGAQAEDVTVWNLEVVDRLADLPGARDVRWWPPSPSDSAGSAWEPEDVVYQRAGLWTLSATEAGHGARVVLQVTIAAERVVFDHSPGYWDGDMADMHGHWRVLVDDRLKWEYFADPQADLGEAGRFPYETASITLGPGEHVVRWELQGCDLAATYFWAIGRIQWDRVTLPASPPTWGALDTP